MVTADGTGDEILTVQGYLILRVMVLNMHQRINLPVLLKKAGLRQAAATRCDLDGITINP